MTAYPNPFDKAINLEYRIEEDAYVTLSVFDLTGKKITTLVDGEQKASTYKVVFDATKHKSASATYIARLTVGDKVYTKQFIQVN